MSAFTHNILLVEDNPGDARLVEMMLEEMDSTEYHLTKTDRISQAVELLDEHDFQAAILDMTLPDGDGLDNIIRLKKVVSDLPIVVLSGRYDEDFALETVKAGAQDYLVKGDIDECRLSRALNYAVERKRLNEDVVYMAHHDQLTGLANRTLFRVLLEHAIQNAQRRKEIVAVLFMDLDHFKPINDTLGHEMGDKLLIEVAQRLSSSVREVDTVGRLGGDEFAIVLEGIDQRKSVLVIAEKIIATLQKEFQIENHSLHIGTSIGVALYPQDGKDVDLLIKNADSAMYKAKKSGGNQQQFYTTTMNHHVPAELTIETQLCDALSNEEFLLHYQPTVELSTGKLSGSEALLRWNPPKKGLQYPAAFIPQLEQSGMIFDVGKWVLEEACKQHVIWQKENLLTGKVAVNLSGQQLLKPDFCRTVDDILRKTGLEPASLEVELTERLLIQNPEITVKVLNELRDIGVSVAIDDFGAGYSSFSCLMQFVIDTIKIDRSFICNITRKGPETAIIAAITQLSNDLGIQVTAEGVETEAQLEFLQNHSIDKIQGFYLSPPVTAEAFNDMPFALIK